VEAKLLQAFPTPIGFFDVPDAGLINPVLKETILERMRREPSKGRSNIGGWHSESDLLGWPVPEVARLRGFILQAVNSMTSEMLAGRPFHGFSQLKAWANVCGRGNYNMLHNHPDNVWSGVYYVDPGAEVPQRPESGTLEFIDPRPSADMVPAPGNPFGRRFVVRPVAGRMVVFPSWLQHLVNPYEGEGYRIAISFNVPPHRSDAEDAASSEAHEQQQPT
jgi:uncharacterized protein (TIGR02466 family)